MNELSSERAAFIMELSDYINERKDLSIAEILYSFQRPMGKYSNKISEILNLSDLQILQRIETAKNLENE